MHAGRGRQVPGDDEHWNDVMYDERHDDQLSRGDRLCGGDVHLIRWTGLVLDLRCQQLLEHGKRGCDELHGLSCE